VKFWLALVAAVALAPAARGLAGAPIRWPRPVEIAQGGLGEVRVSGAELIDVSGRLGAAPVVFYPDGQGVFAALLGADIEAKPGASRLLLTATDRNGVEHARVIPFKVKSRAFRKESFNVPASFDQMSAETLAEIRREQDAFARAFEYSTPERLWEAPFIRPVPQEASASSFGLRRIINGTARAPHSGTDLSAPAGTEVRAANDGRVALVGNFFFAGGSVVIDHGGGLFTMYFHLSELKVEEGVMVQKGEVIALSGATGRVTGPHLHWGARLGNARVDPLELLTKVSTAAPGAGSAPPAVKTKEK